MPWVPLPSMLSGLRGKQPRRRDLPPEGGGRSFQPSSSEGPGDEPSKQTLLANRLITEDKEGGLFTVTLFRKVMDDFKTKARENK